MKTQNSIQCILLLFFIIFCNITIQAQTIIRGHIVDEKGKDMPLVSVLLRQLPDSTISDYAYSDDRGRYQFTYTGNAKTLLISISGMSIAPQKKEINNKSQSVDFRAIEKAIELKEVVVKPTKIWGARDTVNYLVSAFSDRNDVVIGDVLKKCQG